MIAQRAFDNSFKTPIRLAALVCAAVMGCSIAHAQQYQATLLPTLSLDEAFLQHASGGVGVGFSSGQITGGSSHATIFNNLGYIDLHPPGNYPPTGVPFSGSFAYGSGGGQQVGFVIAGLEDVATLWSGSDVSAVFLQAPWMQDSVAYGTDGVNQVGSARVDDGFGNVLTKAIAWSGSAASALDITPGGYPEAFARRVRAGRAAGTSIDDVGFYAATLWTSLTPAGGIILRPANYLETIANDVRGSVVVGHGYPDGGVNHALIWTNDGATLTDVHPPAFFTSFLYGLNATHQVGIVSSTPDIDGFNNEFAGVWSGSSASFVNLHTSLLAIAPQFTDSAAYAIEEDGTIWGLARVGSNAPSAVVKWTLLPSAGTCCRGATCAPLASSACVAAGQAGASFVSGSACSAASVTSPCCYADYDKAGGIAVGDIFAFLNDWFGASPFARVGGDGSSGAPEVGDIFSFLNAWFAGGC
ncbi:MAG: hypothetical protein K2W85_09585 [Phycisphaerales bacterium]|nr:hypothetical protein [Phycisphaerales bacterium]